MQCSVQCVVSGVCYMMETVCGNIIWRNRGKGMHEQGEVEVVITNTGQALELETF